MSYQRNGRGVLWRKPDLLPPQIVQVIQPVQHNPGAYDAGTPEVCPVERRTVYSLGQAGKVGSNTQVVVYAILSSYKVELQGYKSCMGLLMKLADKYTP